MNTHFSPIPTYLAFAIFIVGATVIGFLSSPSKANAGSNTYKSGVVLSGSHKKVHGPSYSYRRSGVLRGAKRKGSIELRNYRSVTTSSTNLNIRRAQIIQRNRDVAAANALRRSNGHSHQGPLVILFEHEDDFDRVVIGTESQKSTCPAHVNCGFRVYQDGSGPRIISLDLTDDDNLPKQDGLNGSKVIIVGN